jgi:hypothetical protein
MPDFWGECIGVGRLCDDDGMRRTDPNHPEPYFCTGGYHVGYQRYLRCDNPRHYAPFEPKRYPAELVLT